MSTRLALAALTLALGASGCAADAPETPDAPSPAAETSDATVATPQVRDTLVVYKTATCGCCQLWNEHMEGEGFVVVSRDVTDLQAVKDSLGIAPEVSACHTGVVGGYVVEGHVPGREVRRLLRERPDARGIAVPGMPLGSPGMEQGDRRDPYDVLLLASDGPPTVFAHVPGSSPR